MSTFHQRAAAVAAAWTLALSGAVATLAAATPAAAQTAPAPAPANPPAQHMSRARLLQSLNLTADQQAQAKQILGAARQQNLNADPQTRHAAMRAAWHQVRDTVLTPDQRTQLRAELQAQKAQAAPAPSPQA